MEKLFIPSRSVVVKLLESDPGDVIHRVTLTCYVPNARTKFRIFKTNWNIAKRSNKILNRSCDQHKASLKDEMDSFLH